MTDRRARMLGQISPALSSGLEIGALHAPMVRREDGPVRYVDYAHAETLRANFRHPDGNAADIVDVDIVWGERPLRDCLDEPVDYVLASHVIEHVPDLIGWLLELHAALKPGGILGLAVPDRRNTFDVRRPVSTPGEMVEAWLSQYRRPSMRQVFDAAALSKDTPEPEDWRPGESVGGLPGEVARRLPLALDLVRGMIAEQRYVDVHCWVFTAASFLDTAEALFRMHCFPYAVDGFYPTEPGSIEFQVRLRTVEDPADPAIPLSITAAREGLSPREEDGANEVRAGTGHRLRAVLRAVARRVRR
jgi:SAM-dependent methyltransferase